jgi:hypothetical protein
MLFGTNPGVVALELDSRHFIHCPTMSLTEHYQKLHNVYCYEMLYIKMGFRFFKWTSFGP